MWGQHFDRCHFRPPTSTIIPKRGSKWGGAIIWHWNYGQLVADRANLYIERYWVVVGRLSIGTNPNALHSKLPL